MWAIIKAVLSGIMVALISEVARRHPAAGALIASLPLVSVLAMIWLWRETGDTARIATHAETTFWYVLPSLPLFLVFPALLRQGVGFYVALGLSCAVTVVLYVLMTLVLRRFGVVL